MHEFKAEVDGKPEQVWRIEIKNGESYNHDFDIGATNSDTSDKPLPEVKKDDKSSRPIPKLVFIVGGATVVLGAAGAVVGGVFARGALADYEAANGKEPNKAKLEEMRSKVVTMNVIADVSFGLALAGAVTTVVLFVKRPEKKAEPTKEALGFSPWVTPQGSGAMVWGTL